MNQDSRKIIHICTSHPLSEDALYQENVLTNKQSKEGDDVIIFGSNTEYLNGKLNKVQPSKKRLQNNVEIQRFNQLKIFNDSISRKICYSKNLYNALNIEKPDIIFYHTIYGFDLLQVFRYAKKSGCILLIDTHADYKNSAQNIFSKIFLHKFIIRTLIKFIDGYVKNYFYIAKSCKDFALEMYDLNPKKLIFLPLAYDHIDYKTSIERKNLGRKKFNLPQNSLIFCHAGKMDNNKKTIDLLEIFSKLNYDDVILILVGTFSEEIEIKASILCNANKNIINYGWTSGEVLSELISCADLYLQPGSQSINMQLAIANYVNVAVYPHKNYVDKFDDSIFYVVDSDDLRDLFVRIYNDRNVLYQKNKKLTRIRSNIPSLDDTLLTINNAIIDK